MREWLAHVRFRGVIGERTVDPFLRMLRALRDRRRVRGVLMDIASGGGAAVPSYDLYLAIKRLDQVKPVVTSIGSVGASGAYMAALGGRRVYAYPDSAVGSIGVVYPHIAMRGLLDKLGIGVELLHEGRHKDAFQGLRPLTEEERTKLQAVTHDDYTSFVDLVARERHRTPEQILPLATGEFWSGRRALELGLVDALGDREVALEELSRMTGVPARRTIRVTPPRPFFERLFSGGSAVVGERLVGAVRDGLEELLYDALLSRKF
jgi:protease IV